MHLTVLFLIYLIKQILKSTLIIALIAVIVYAPFFIHYRFIKGVIPPTEKEILDKCSEMAYFPKKYVDEVFERENGLPEIKAISPDEIEITKHDGKWNFRYECWEGSYISVKVTSPDTVVKIEDLLSHRVLPLKIILAK